MKKMRQEFLGDVVICVAEDFGYNSWRQVDSYYHDEDYPQDNYVTLVNVEDVMDPFKFDIAEAERGIKLILDPNFSINSKLREALAEDNRENDACNVDAEIADCILQAAWFGELVYG